MTLKEQAISGVKWTTFGSIFNALIQTVQIVILTRLLNATDFGLMAIVMIVIGFSQMFIDMGVSNAIIYKQEVSKNQLTSLYWLNIFMGVTLFIVVIFISPLVASFYKSPQLTKLIIVVGITFLIQPFGQQFMILLQKNMEFNKITKTQIYAKLFSFIVIIILALMGFGVFSLAIGAVSYSIVSTVFFIYYGRKIYKPKFHFKKSDLSEFISFGLFQMGEKIIQYFSSQFDTILIGKLLGIETLGIYNVAKNLISKPSVIINPVITKVTFPLMSKMNQDIDFLKRVYLKTIKYLGIVNYFVYISIAILAKPLVLILFGNNWIETIPIIQILAIAFLLSSIGNPAGSLLLSRGKANIAFYWNLAIFILYPIFIIIGSKSGIIGVSLSLVALRFTFLFPNWKFIVFKMCNASFKEYFLNVFKPLILNLPPAILTIIISNYLHERFIQLLTGLLVYSGFYLFLLYKFYYSELIDISSFIMPKFIIKKLK